VDSQLKDLVNYFIARTDQRFDRIERQIEESLQFKWQLIGGSVAVSAVVSLAVAVYFGK
jgi:hypothetical protein